MAVVVGFTAVAAEGVTTAVVVAVALRTVAAADIAATAAHIVAVAATAAARLAVMLVAALTEAAADIRGEFIAAALRTAVATEPAHRWRRAPRAATLAAGIRLVMEGIVRR